MMPRFIVHILLLSVITLSSAYAQSQATVPRIGFLTATTPDSAVTLNHLAGFHQGLREHGYMEGTNIAIDYRFAHQRFERLPDLARELIGLPVDVLVTAVTQASVAAKDNTRTIPIVMAAVADPVGAGLVSSLARPGGNITGTSSMSVATAAKSLELLREAVPGIRRVAVLWNPANRIFQMQMVRETEAAARSLGIQLQMYEAHDLPSIERAFETISKERVAGLNILADPTLNTHAPRIAALAEKARLPSVSGIGLYAEAGGLMGYGANFYELYRSAAGYVAKILKGAKPADLPIEQPTKFELVINMKTAKRLGVSLPQSLLLRADRLIE
ncbi:MAG TPA: ABC transporter substrate-binding protein [Casimicrobiaceae bacterium]|jgi:putative ABC transport system substrate-binding protein|nr:ABC transporter substrate-binding protein [Casimicrobiaceae bacterium]